MVGDFFSLPLPPYGPFIVFFMQFYTEIFQYFVDILAKCHHSEGDAVVDSRPRKERRGEPESVCCTIRVALLCGYKEKREGAFSFFSFFLSLSLSLPFSLSLFFLIFKF